MSFEIWRRDPIVEVMNPVDRPAVRAMIAARPTILARCDDDDLLHRTYIARAREELAGHTGPTALTFLRGGYLYGGRVYPKRYPWFTAGLAVLPDERAQITPYLFNHPRFGIDMRQRGYEAREIDTRDPMWLRSVSATSDAGARRRRRPWRRIRPWPWERPASVDLADFGATHEGVEELEDLLAKSPVAPNPQPQKSRLAQKMEIAKKIRALTAAAGRTAEDDAEIERLTNALYDL
jgi:hypothetical protein